jgi:3D-(3,5/4)-trihydroxycyclohexane-1,2-dione acylhydrolase (decyclizing)
MSAETIRLTMSQALVRYLIAQQTVLDGATLPLIPGIFAIFGHGNVAGLGEALAGVRSGSWPARRPSALAQRTW